VAAVAACLPLAAAAVPTLVPDLPSVAQLTPANGLPLEVGVLDASLGDPPAANVTSGALDRHFVPFAARGSHRLRRRCGFGSHR
jgi:hypothetical protein